MTLPIEVDPGESLADTDAQSGVIDIRPFRKPEEALFHKFGLQTAVSSLATTKQWALEAKPRFFWKGGDALRFGRRQWHSEVYRG